MKNILLCLFYLLGIQLGYTQNRTEALILELSKKKNTYCNAKEADKLRSILDDRLVFIHSNGMTESKEEMIQNLKDEKWNIKKVDIKESNIRIYKNNIAILIGKGSFNVDANKQDLTVELYFTEVWTHVKKGWLLASRHALRLPN